MFTLMSEQINLLRELKKNKKYVKTVFYFKEDKVELLRLAQLVEFNLVVRTLKSKSEAGLTYNVELTRDGLDWITDFEKKSTKK